MNDNTCSFCRSEIPKPGGLLFSPPDTETGSCPTYNICVDCYAAYFKPIIDAAKNKLLTDRRFLTFPDVADDLLSRSHGLALLLEKANCPVNCASGKGGYTFGKAKGTEVLCTNCRTLKEFYNIYPKQ